MAGHVTDDSATTHCTDILLPGCFGTPSADVSQPVKELTHSASVGVFIQWCVPPCLQVPVPQPTWYPNVWSISGPTDPDY